MSPRHRPNLPATEEQTKAQRAVRKAMASRRSWEGFIRSISKKKLNVKLSSTISKTDGETVYIQVPMEYADDIPHVRKNCYTRGDNGEFVCEACKLNELITYRIYHEMAHTLHDSFENIDYATLDKICKDAFSKEKYNDLNSNHSDYLNQKNYWAIFRLFGEFFPLIANALEDIRVNSMMFQVRPGTKVTFKNYMTNIMERGVVLEEGQDPIFYKDCPLNTQLIIAFWMKAVELDYDDDFYPSVIEDLKTPESIELIASASSTRSIHEVMEVSQKFLTYYQTLGYFEEPPPDENGEGEEQEQSPGSGGASQEEQEGDSDENQESDSDENQESDSDENQESDSDEEQESDSDEEQESDSDENKPEPGTPEQVEAMFSKFSGHEDAFPESDLDEDEVEIQIQQAEFFDTPSRNIERVDVFTDLQGPAWNSRHIEIQYPSSTVLNPATMRLRKAFQVNAAQAVERDLVRGKRLDHKNLGRRFPVGDPRVFTKKTEPGRRDYFVVIGLDISGSTYGQTIEDIKMAGMAQAEMLSKVGVRFAVYAHTGEREALQIYEVKAPHETWSIKAKERLWALGSSNANLDGHTLEFYRKVAERDHATNKIIMYYTDGCMPAENYAEELEILQQNIAICKKQNILLVGVGVQNDDPLRHGLDMIRFDDPEEDLSAVVNGLRNRMAKL